MMLGGSPVCDTFRGAPVYALLGGREVGYDGCWRVGGGG